MLRLFSLDAALKSPSLQPSFNREHHHGEPGNQR
jgi:hypothetical protein